MEMTVQRALNELNTLESRIDKRLSDFRIIGTRKNSENRVSETREPVADFAVRAKTIMDSADALLKRQQQLKHAIMTSNAQTMIEVAGVTYSVMTAIDRKRTIESEKQVLACMKQALRNAETKVSRENDKVEDYIQRQVLAMASGDLANKRDEFITSFEKSYRDKNGWDLVDPLGLRDLIEKREQEILDFELEIDTALTVSNAITKIVIED
jgi:hypothetical protein